MMKSDNKCWVRGLFSYSVIIGRASWLKSQDGSVSSCTEERTHWCSFCMLKWLLKCWVLFSRQNCMFSLLFCHIGCFLELLSTWGTVSCRWHLWSLSLSTENRKAFLFKSMSLNLSIKHEQWSEKLLFSITELSCCPLLWKVTCLKSVAQGDDINFF